MANDNSKPTISCSPNGPYIVSGLKELRDQNGASLSVDGKAALCRCGASVTKPFCDGTHAKIGFQDHKTPDRAANQRDTYIGRSITIHDNRSVCAHAGVCTEQLPAVWRMKHEPWIDPDGATMATIIDVINQCPSGALSYSVGGSDVEPSPVGPIIEVTKNGPYAVTGIEFLDQAPDVGTTKEKYTLCRCGASKNKPFCDGTHWAVDFQDDSDGG